MEVDGVGAAAGAGAAAAASKKSSMKKSPTRKSSAGKSAAAADSSISGFNLDGKKVFSENMYDGSEDVHEALYDTKYLDPSNVPISSN